MNEAKQLHRDLMNAIVPILPRTVYHDIRRVVTLAWAVTGLCRKGTVRLSAWAEEVTSAAHYAASRVRRFARWLHNPAIDPTKWYPPTAKGRSARLDATFSRVCCPGHNRVGPLCADPGLVDLSGPGYPASLARPATK